MRRRFVVAAVIGAFVLGGSQMALAQDQNNPETLRKELAETMSQLKAAQDRVNELANEYEKLKAQMATTQKQLEDAQRTVAENAQQSYQLRSHTAAWNAFVDHDSRLRARWQIFLETSMPDLTLGEWPLDKPMPQSLFGATTQPTTQSATQSTTGPAMTPTTAPGTTTNPSGQ